ncbi:MAG: hypothetical protein WBQ25_12565 [Nitrososphaeraceae archaeon]
MGSKGALAVGSLQNHTDLTQAENQLTFHLLIDIGKGALNSLQSIKSMSDLTSFNSIHPHINTSISGAIASPAATTTITKDRSDPPPRSSPHHIDWIE